MVEKSKCQSVDHTIPQNKIWRAELARDVDGIEANGEDHICDFFGDQIETRRTSPSQEIVCVMVVAPTLWKNLQMLMTKLGVTIVHILNVFHVMDYLWDAVRCVHGCDDEATEVFVTERLQRILTGEVGRVIGGFKQMLAKDRASRIADRKFNATQCKTLNKVIQYFDRRKKFTRYDIYLAKAHAIVRDVVEGACGHVVKDRMEGSGMRWTVSCAQSMLDLRCVYFNGNWKDFHDYRICESVYSMYAYRDLLQQQYRATG